MMKKQFELDKKETFRKLAESSLLKTPVTTSDHILFNFQIEGVKNESININKDLKKQVISNQISELVYFSFEIQRQIILIYESDSNAIPQNVLDNVLQSIVNINGILFSNNAFEWYDHCVTNRSVFLRDLMIFMAKRNDFRNYQKIYKIHYKHIDFILSKTNYDYLTNHGIISDTYGLLALRGFQSKKYLAMASKFYNRSIDRIDHYISDDGIPLESSSTYWFLIYKLYKKILNIGSQYFDFEPDASVKLKLKKTEDFFDIINLNGKFLRIGQSSGGHEYPIQVYEPKKLDHKNEVIVHQFDTGLILVNTYDSEGKVKLQLLVNTQKIHPKVHGHEDNGAICLYYKDQIYIDTPGSFKFKGHTEGIKVNPKSYKNQSTTYTSNSGYLDHVCDVKVNCKEDQVEINYRIYNESHSIYRNIVLDVKKTRLTIQDRNNKEGQPFTSQYLLAKKGKLEDSNYKLNEINFKFSSLPTVEKGYLTVERGKAQVVPLLKMNGLENSVEIDFDIEEMEKINFGTHSVKNYNKRKTYSSEMKKNRMKRRFLNLFVKINKLIKR